MLRKWSPFALAMSRQEFEQELRDYLPDMYRVARGLTRDAVNAEDLTQDTCTKAIASFDNAKLRSQRACRAWLNQILLNTFRDNYRRQQRSPIDEYVNPENVIDFVPSRDSSPEHSMNDSRFERAFHDVLQTLPPEVRFATVLHLVRGFAYREIATVMNCPIGTVMSRIASGRKTLRSELTAFIDDAVAESARGNGDES